MLNELLHLPLFWLCTYFILAYAGLFLLLKKSLAQLLKSNASNSGIMMAKMAWSGAPGKKVKDNIKKPQNAILIGLFYLVLAPVLFPLLIITIVFFILKRSKPAPKSNINSESNNINIATDETAEIEFTAPND